MSLTINTNLMAQNAARNISSHYAGLGKSVQRLSSGLRINSAVDDAAGLAIRELMRAETASLRQGIRNANDAISMIQVADGALQIIDEKLIRMKELATQAATGTYNSDQRLILDSEYQQMASEIQRIAQSTKFNGVYLLNGNLSGIHNGNGLESNGAAKIHFGPTNNEQEDYYHIKIPASNLVGLKLAETIPNVHEITSISDIFPVQNEWVVLPSGVRAVAVIPAGSRNVNIDLFDHGANDDLQIFTRSGVHLAGTGISPGSTWDTNSIDNSNVDTDFITFENGFSAGSTYSTASLVDPPYNDTPPYNISNSYNSGMTIGFSGDNNPANLNEYFTVDNVIEDLLIFSVGQ